MMAASVTKRRYYGPWITAAIFISFGITVGVPYYGMPFFYDYFTQTFGWTGRKSLLDFRWERF